MGLEVPIVFYIVVFGVDVWSQRRILNLELFAKMVNDLQLLTILAKSSILDVWLDFEYASKSRDAVHI